MGNGSKDLFLDAARYTLDDKQRVALPAAFRLITSIGGLGPFALTVGADRCLAVYPVEEWKRLQSFITPQFLGLDRIKFARYTRFLYTHTTYVSADQQGRIRIPQALLDYARLSREVLIYSMGNRLELWNPAEHDKFIGPVEDFDDAQSRLQFDTMGRETSDFSPFGLPDAFATMPVATEEE